MVNKFGCKLGLFAMKTKKNLENLLKSVLSNGPYELVSLVYLFGSRAEKISEGKNGDTKIGPLSDYDFGVFLFGSKEEIADFSTGKRFKLQSGLASKLDSKVDVIVLNNSPIELQYNAISFGVRVFESGPETRVEYESRVLSLYGDYLPVLRSQRDDVISGGNTSDARVQRYREALGQAERVFKQARTSEG